MKGFVIGMIFGMFLMLWVVAVNGNDPKSIAEQECQSHGHTSGRWDFQKKRIVCSDTREVQP